MGMMKAIIFDLGGVILNINYGLTIEQLSKLSGTNFADIYTQQRQTSLFDEFETGKIQEQEFRYRLKSLLQTDIADQVLDHAWNAMLLDIPPSRIDYLEQVAARKRIFLLSNTNAIHKRAFDRIVQNSLGDRLSDFSQLFEKAYYSHLVGDRKPNASIFERVLAENHLDPHQTLFIDDTLGHIEGAKHVGLQTLHLTNGQTIEELDILHS
jgi:putative hydrolase of the HAD superfamily